jgi:integrase/recombinase XerD
MHATARVNGGVSLATSRTRRGHKNLQTTVRDDEQSDATMDAELRAWRRQRSLTSSKSSQDTPVCWLVY